MAPGNSDRKLSDSNASNNTNSNNNNNNHKSASVPPSFSIPHPTRTSSAANNADDCHVGRIPRVLPHERVFPIQIGSELFKLSGASLSSDAPSYFSQYFQSQIGAARDAGEDPCTHIRTLYIDRDPATFHDISLHLQGYHVKPRDGTHFVRLFADAQFYSLPRLISQLFEEHIFISIGLREFQIPRDIFTGPGNTPNFFSLGFAIFFSRPDDLFPGLDREDLIRPPAITPPAVHGRSADIFADLLDLLRGYPITIRDETHRAALLRDCRYFNFKGLEQRLIPHDISFNQTRGRNEILIRLEDILKSGISILPEDPSAGSSASYFGAGDPVLSWVQYARPYVDDKPAELVLEIGSEATRLRNPPNSNMVINGSSPRAEFFRDTRSRIARLFEVIATKLNLPPTIQPLGLLMASGGAGSQPATPGNTPLSDDLVRVVITSDTHIILDGKPFVPPPAALLAAGPATPIPSSAVKAPTPTPGPTSAPAATEPGSNVAANPADELSIPAGYRVREGSHDSVSSVRAKRRRLDSHGNAAAGDLLHGIPGSDAWTIKTGQWRLLIRGSTSGKSAVECVLVAVRLDAYSCESTRNAARGFLGGV